MENLEVILVDFQKDKLDQLVFEELQINIAYVKSSHFYDPKLKKDIEFYQVKSLKNLLFPSGTGNIFLNQLELGYSIKELLIVFSFDEEYGDIVLNFPESQMFTRDGSENNPKWKKLLQYFLALKNKFDIPKIRIGFEPASDDDTCLVELNEKVIDIDVLAENIQQNLNSFWVNRED